MSLILPMGRKVIFCSHAVDFLSRYIVFIYSNSRFHILFKLILFSSMVLETPFV